MIDITQANLASAVAEARAAGVISGAEAERVRIGAILGGEAAKGREPQARYFAFKTSMSAADALTALDVAPVGRAVVALRIVDASDVYARREAASGRRRVSFSNI